ncbi:rho GTPase-activating protein 24-like isoform X1 [Vespula pensylvanica]|uniref:rho GTPase-activating protein 24-like isoform X1 n=1 Tax=Vespula pensylvanica TaxID=30213 RepID=UPI001CB9F87C|nr:rho GTPase-activating protein 24-like isoform X1 [Vespula pensylvanica]
MLIYDVLHKEKVYEIVINDLRNIGIKYRFKKNAIKTDKFERSKNISKKVFRTPLSYQPLNVVNLSSGGIVHVPVFVSQASAFLEKHITQEGLFRKAGSHMRQKELMAYLDKGSLLGEKNHAIDVANCLKTFFRDLPEPLIPYTYHDLFLHCAMLKNHRVQALLLACVLLPPYHLNTLAFIMEFLKKVSLYEKQNKMSIDNLAKVIGPNIMPLREVTMMAVQSRLELHLIIVKILIENAENIGVLPEHITHLILSEVIGSIDNELDLSDSQLHGKLKKKKYRSGSLTRKPHLSASNLNLRMLHGLKKIVGKSTSPINAEINENQDSVTNSNMTCTSSTKSTKKRKVIEWLDPQSTKKKRISDKIEKSKKTGLSIDRFVSKNKQKVDSSSSILTFNPYADRRWSLAHNSPISFEQRRTNSDGSLHLKKSILKETETSNSNNRNNYSDVFVDADINLSDYNNEQVSLKKEDNNTDNHWHLKFNKNSEKLKHTNKHSETSIETAVTKDECEEYVRIPKSEYEEIKNRVSAIESRISQEFGYIDDVRNESLVENSVNKVQTEYEKTLEEAGIKNIVTADHLARKLGKELKIRRSSERKVIRSPSARKIGSLRRRSQEKIKSKCINRTDSWHASQEWQHKYRNQSNEQEIVCLANEEPDIAVKLTKQVSSLRNDPLCTSETNTRLELLQKQLNALISHTTEHTRDSLTDDESIIKDINMHTPKQSPLKFSVRRASSFHGNEFINNSFYFNRKVKELKKTNSQQNVFLNNDYQDRQNNIPQNWKETSISWKDAGDYFKSTLQIRTPVPQTGRASVAKLRTQNAGMVLAKAKLFDENTIKVSTCTFDNGQNQKGYVVNTNKKELAKESKSEKINNMNIEKSCCDLETKRNISTHKRLERHSRNRDLTQFQSSKISLRNKNNSMDISLEINEEDFEKHYNRRHSEKYNQNLLEKGNKSPMQKSYYSNDQNNREKKCSPQKENVVIRSPSILKNTSTNKVDEESNVNIYKSENGICKTPRIKRPLAIKTPKSSKSLARRPPIDTRRTPLKAIAHLEVSKYQSPKRISKPKNLMNEH